jgi:succinate-acetate transporter protein
MNKALLGILKSAVFFAYGLFTLCIYGLKAIQTGFFFRNSTEKENLELQLGMYARLFSQFNFFLFSSANS